MSRPVVKTLADLKRIPVGTKLRLVASLMGPTPDGRQLRTVVRVTATQMVSRIEEGQKAGQESFLHFPPASRFRADEVGFTVLDVDDRDGSYEVAAQYVFVDDVDAAHGEATMEGWARAMTPKPAEPFNEAVEALAASVLAQRVPAPIELEHGTLYPIPSKPCGRCGQGEAAGAAGLCRECDHIEVVHQRAGVALDGTVCPYCEEPMQDEHYQCEAAAGVGEGPLYFDCVGCEYQYIDTTGRGVCDNCGTPKPTTIEPPEAPAVDPLAQAAERTRRELDEYLALRYAIINDDGCGVVHFWAKDGCWHETGDDFTATERAHYALPVGGKWVCGKCGQGDPASAGHVCR